MTLTDLWQTCNALLPELVLTVAICAIVLADMFTPLRLSRTVCGALALLGVMWAFWLIAARFTAVYPVPFRARGDFGDMIGGDNLSLLLRLLFLGGTGAVILFSMRTRELAGYRHGEYFALLLGAVLAAGLLVSSRNFIMFVLSLETLSMCSYVLAGFIKHERPSAEAGLKYLLYGAVASGVMLFGISYLYGLTGSIEIPTVIAHYTSMIVMRNVVLTPINLYPQQLLPFLLALLLVLVGLGFKIAMVPFQFWAPDVYQGAPTPITAFLSVVSKFAGFAALLRLLLPLFQPLESHLAGLLHLPLLFGLLAVLTMTFGNLVALRQTDIKRLFGYSSIAHAGYLLMGLAVFSGDALRAILAYFIIYLFMNLGAFWVVTILVSRLGGAELDRFRGARLKAPFLFWVMFIFLISLTGLPPTAGFTAKLMVFGVVVNKGLVAMSGGALTPVACGWFALALAGVLNSAISLAYYMKIAKVMAFDPPADETPIALDWFDRALALTFAVPTLALLYFTPVLALVARAI